MNNFSILFPTNSGANSIGCKPECLQSKSACNEEGYTLQTLIIIAILVLGATIAFTIIYAILDDSTDNIVGGSETFSGEPGPPQNIEYVLSPSMSMPGVDTTSANIFVSWEAPSYLGEYQLSEYSLTIDDSECEDIINDGNSYSCEWENGPIDCSPGMKPKLQFTLMFDDIGNISYPEIVIEEEVDEFCSQKGSLTQQELEAEEALKLLGTFEFEISSKVDRGLILPEVEIVSYPCEDGQNEGDGNFTYIFYWNELSNSQTGGNEEFIGCTNILDIDFTQNGDIYSIWGEVRTDSEVIQESRVAVWVPSYDEAYNPDENRPNPPTNVRVFPILSQELRFTWEHPIGKAGVEISDYAYSLYDDLCENIDSEDTPIDGPTFVMEPRIPVFGLDIDTEGEALCLEIISIAETSESEPVRVNTPVPTQIPGGINFSWIEVNSWGDKATVRWQANYPSEIAYFEIFTSGSTDSYCTGTPKISMPEPFGEVNKFVETINLRDGGNKICVRVTYQNGNEYNLHYFQTLDGEEQGYSLSAYDTMLEKNENAFDLTGKLRAEYHYVYYLCFEVGSTPDYTLNNMVTSSIRVVNNKPPDDSSIVINVLDSGEISFTYSSIIPDATDSGTYRGQAWVSTQSTCPYIASRASNYSIVVP